MKRVGAPYKKSLEQDYPGLFRLPHRQEEQEVLSEIKAAFTDLLESLDNLNEIFTLYSGSIHYDPRPFVKCWDAVNNSKNNQPGLDENLKYMSGQCMSILNIKSFAKHYAKNSTDQVANLKFVSKLFSVLLFEVRMKEEYENYASQLDLNVIQIRIKKYIKDTLGYVRRFSYSSGKRAYVYLHRPGSKSSFVSVHKKDPFGYKTNNKTSIAMQLRGMYMWAKHFD